MTDTVVSGYPSVTLYGKPRASSTAYALAATINFAHPYASEDIAEFATVLQTDANVASEAPLSKEQVIDALKKYNVLYIDHQDLVDEATASGNYDPLRHECASANRNAVVQLFIVQHGNKLALAVNNPSIDANAPLSVDGSPLRAFAKDEPYAFVRIGFANDRPIGRYALDPVTSALPIEKPTPITWSNITSCQIVACIFVLDSDAVEIPPTDFRYFGGIAADGSLLPDNIWPVPMQSLDVAPIIASVQQVLQASNQSYSDEITALNTRVNVLNASKQQSDVAFLDILHKLGLKDAPMQQSVL